MMLSALIAINFMYSATNVMAIENLDLEDIWIRDPNLFYYDGKYYLTGTTHNDGFLGYSSTDMVDWEYHGLIYQRNSSNYWANYLFWAPEVVVKDDTFYMFFTAKNDTTHRATGVAVSNDPMGPYIDLMPDPLTPSDYDCLDGHLYDEGNGSQYLVYVNEWIQDGVEGTGAMWIQETSSDYTHLVGEPVELFEGGDADWSNRVVDGPSMIKHEGTYYLFWSSFGPSGYNVGYAYSENLHAGYQQSSKPVINDDSGHSTWFYNQSSGHRLVVFHHPNSGEAEHAVIRRLIWDEGRGTWKIDPPMEEDGIPGASVYLLLLLAASSVSIISRRLRISTDSSHVVP